MTSASVRRLLLLPVLAAGLLLSSCATSPGTAVRVGGFTLSRADLEEVTQAQCVLAGAAQQASNERTSRATTAQSTIAVVVQARQALAYARTHDVSVDESQLRTVRASFSQQLKGQGLSAAQRDSLLDTADVVNRGQLVQQRVGAEKLGLPATSAQTAAAQQALSAGAQVVTAWATKSGPDVSIDPRYNITVDDGQLKLSSSSVSVPVSSGAKQAAAQQQSASYVSSLPVPQRCG